jgi:hypothetical protein
MLTNYFEGDKTPDTTLSGELCEVNAMFHRYIVPLKRKTLMVIL